MNQTIEQQVQRLGQLRQQRQQVETEEDLLARSVRSQMAEHGLSTVKSGDYEAKLVTQERLAVDAAAFQRAVTKAEFLQAASISVTTAREILGDRKLRKISTVTESVQLRIAARVRQATPNARDAASREATA